MRIVSIRFGTLVGDALGMRVRNDRRVGGGVLYALSVMRPGRHAGIGPQSDNLQAPTRKYQRSVDAGNASRQA